MNYFKIIRGTLLVGMAIAGQSLFCLIASAQIQPDLMINQRPPDPPRTPPPNQTRPGGGLNPVTSELCSPLNDTVRALIPVENPVLTTSAYPTFLFYVPFGADQVRYGEFSLLVWPRELQRHYKVRFALPEQPGIVSVTLPDSPDYELDTNQYYRWYFQLYCQDGHETVPDLTVHGMVQRVAASLERDRPIESGPEIWYDTAAAVAEQLQRSPHDAQLQQDWRNLLQSIDAEDLAQEPFVGSVIPIDE